MGKLGVVQLVVLAVYICVAAIVYPSLPDRIPTHFNLDGVADDWSRTSFWSWFALPAICLVISAFFHIIGLLSERYPAAFNVPDKDKYLALSADDRAPVIATMRTLLHTILLGLTLLFAALQTGMYQVGSGATETLPWYTRGMLLLVIVSPPLVLPFFYIRVTNQIQSAVRRQPKSGAPA